MQVKIEESWKSILAEEFEKPYFAALASFVKSAYQGGTVYPPPGRIFEAFKRTPFDKVRVVILGQDPYHEPGQAQGLAFYVPPNVPVPPSLRNIAKELGHMPDLLSWTDQGVLLLNATLTVAAHRAGSHQNRGWEIFTDAVVRALAERRENLGDAPQPDADDTWGARKARINGTVAHTTAIFGFALAGLVVQDIARKSES